MLKPARLAAPLIAFCAVAALLSTQARAWGPLGHRMIAETAALLLEDERPVWGALFERHRFELGFYAMMPDAIYRYKDGQNGELEGPTHFFDVDVLAPGPRKAVSAKAAPLPAGLAELPRDYAGAKARVDEKVGKDRLPKLGTAPWRVEQFVELARREASEVSAFPAGYQRGSTAEGEAGKIYRTLFYLGAMAHYTGDSLMPYHASEDWNGWKQGLGGIHFYFEGDCVNALEPGLSSAVLGLARKHRKEWLEAWNASREPAPGVLFHVYEDSFRAIPEIEKIDRKHSLLEPSDAATRRFARRKPSREGCPSFKNLLQERLAKAAVLTAHLWTRALPASTKPEAAGKPPLQFADFETSPRYVAPEYLQQATR